MIKIPVLPLVDKVVENVLPTKKLGGARYQKVP
jgi:hypothetical protein